MTGIDAAAGALWPSFLDPAHQGRPDLCAVSANGVRVRFADGVERIDGASGLWNTNLGYGNPVIAGAVAEALRDASYLNVFRYENVYARQAAEALVAAAGGHFARVLFSTSGGAANDLVVKLTRHYHVLRGDPDRRLVVGLDGSYHGLTYGSFGLTGEELGQALYGVDRRLVAHVPPNDLGALDRLLRGAGRRTAAVVVEPVLGTGAIPLTDEYVAALVRAREAHGFLLVADEVATGFGRTGGMFASTTWARPPDLLVTSKALTNGTCAAAAVLVGEEVARAFHGAGEGASLVHGETQAGTPPSCAAVIATLDELDRLDALAAGQALAKLLDDALAILLAESPHVAAVTGIGCFRSIRLVDAAGEPLSAGEVPAVVDAVRRAGAIAHPGLHGIQLVPALTMTPDELEQLLAAVRRGIADYAATRTAERAPDRSVSRAGRPS